MQHLIIMKAALGSTGLWSIQVRINCNRKLNCMCKQPQTKKQENSQQGECSNILQQLHWETYSPKDRINRLLFMMEGFTTLCMIITVQAGPPAGLVMTA